MSSATIYIDGDALSFMGNVTDKFLPYNNTIEAARDGRIFVTSEAAVKTVSVDDLKIDIEEFPAIKQFFSECGSKKFNVSIVFDEDCASDLGNGNKTYHYIDCIIQGEPEFSIFERKISNFEFGYSRSFIKLGL